MNYCKYQVNPHSSPWFLDACAAATAHRIAKLFCYSSFPLYQQNVCKNILAKSCDTCLCQLNKRVLLSRNFALVTFDELLIVFSTKLNLLSPLCLMALRLCVLHLIQQNCLLKSFLRTQILLSQVSLYLLSFLKLI